MRQRASRRIRYTGIVVLGCLLAGWLSVILVNAGHATTTGISCQGDDGVDTASTPRYRVGQALDSAPKSLAEGRCVYLTDVHGYVVTAADEPLPEAVRTEIVKRAVENNNGGAGRRANLQPADWRLPITSKHVRLLGKHPEIVLHALPEGGTDASAGLAYFYDTTRYPSREAAERAAHEDAREHGYARDRTAYLFVDYADVGRHVP